MSPETPCPSAQLLRRSLNPDDPMREPERQRIEAHVDHCTRGCKQTIDALLRGNTLPGGPATAGAVNAPGAVAPESPTRPGLYGNVDNLDSDGLGTANRTLPGYEILEEIARGGMGVVYKARQTGLDRLAAVKMLLGGARAGTDAVARFRVEAEAVARVRHPHIVQIYEVGECDGLLFLALEYMEGGSLAQKIARAPQPARAAAAMVETLARAVHVAHQQGVIHRDLKPANVLLAADGTPKIADFGLAKRLGTDAGQTRTGEILGTPSYMAPEQAAPGTSPMGTPADVWALGAILYEMLTGRPPFQGETPWDVLTQVVSADPLSPRRLQPKTPADLETICLKCLRKETPRRYGSAEALADDLRRFLTGRPIQARRVGVAERAVKWVRRNAVVTALLAVVVLATAGGVGGWLWAALDRAARQAEADRLAAGRLSRAEGTAQAALGKAEEDEAQATAIEQAADAKGQEEPETPETAKRVLEWRRQAAASLDEAERALAEVLGAEKASERSAERRQAIKTELGRAEKAAGLLDDLDRARASRAAITAGAFDTNSAARLYAAALSAYGLDLSKPEAETAAEIRQARPGVRLALVIALDDWASCVRFRNAVEAEPLGRIADGADDDDWRRRYRAAAGDVGALKRLAEEAPGRHLPAVSQIQLAADLCVRGARPEAVTLLRSVRRQHPTDFWVYYELHYCLLDPAHPNPATLDEAESCACAAVALRPDSAGAHINLGNVLYAQGDRDGAAACYRKAIELDPKFAPAHCGLGLVLDDQGDREGAAQCYKKAIELDPKYSPAHYNFGRMLYAQGDRDAAAQYYRKALELDPKVALAHYGLGDVLYDQGDRDGAADCYRKAIELDPKNAPAQCGLGDVLYDQGDRDGAADCYRKAIELDPKDARSHNGLGNVMRDQGKPHEGADEYRKAIEIDPKYAPPHSNLGSVLYDQGDRDGAVACYRKAVEFDPKNAQIHCNLGLVLYAQGNREGAAACYRKAIELDPKYVPAQCGLGDVRRDQGDRDGAADCYHKVIELDPKNAPAHCSLGTVLFDQGDLAGAAAHYQQAVEIDPKYAVAHYSLGLALGRQGHFAEARTSFRRGLDLTTPNDPLRAKASDDLRYCERLLALESKLGPVLKGEQQPANDAERLGLVEVCRYQRRYAAAARFCREAFADDPKLADDLKAAYRYNAAVDAARAGCGQGEDAMDLDDNARAGWRKQALDWLEADLDLRTKQLDGGKPEDRTEVGQKLRYWQTDAALAGLRDAAELAKLPADEQEACRKFWGDVQAIIDKTGDKK